MNSPTAHDNTPTAGSIGGGSARMIQRAGSVLRCIHQRYGYLQYRSTETVR